MSSKYWLGVKEILETLFFLQKADWEKWEDKEERDPRRQRSPALMTKKIISGWGWVEINEAKLNSLLAVEGPIRFAGERLFLFLPPFPKEEREFVPVVSLEYDPSQDCLSVRVAMYRCDESGKPMGFGFRLESPTSNCSKNGNISIHDFYHVQMIRSIGRAKSYGPPLELPEWWPCRHPAFCVRAENSIDALLNLILSLYGLDYYKEFLKPIKSRIGSHIKLMRAFFE